MNHDCGRQTGVAYWHLPLLSCLLDTRRISDGKIVADDLQVLGDTWSELDPTVPVILVKGILDRDDGEVAS